MKILIIGGGPAGIAAALAAKTRNNTVILLEKNNRIGKKLLATGNGRCNYSNEIMTPQQYNNPEFVGPLLKRFTTQHLVSYFQMMGLESTHEGNRIYPLTLKSNSVLNILLRELDRRQVKIVTDCRVGEIIRTNNSFLLETTQGKMKSDVVVFAAGGSSMPSSGSDGSSFSMVKKLGHRVSELHPALTQLKLKCEGLKTLSGVKVQGKAKLIWKEELIQERSGDLLFTDYGISGPPILDLSVYCSQASDMVLEMPLLNHVDENTRNMLYNRYYVLGHLSLEDFLMGIVDKKITYYLLKQLNWEKNLTVSTLSQREFSLLVEALLQSQFPIIGNTGFQHSQVTRGGILTEEVFPETFASKIVKHLYIVGEALDIDGICGGYNLHFAFGSGTIAGRSIQQIGEVS